MRKLLMILGLLSTINLSSYAATITLEWDPSVSPEVTGYRVYVGTASRTYGTPITIGNVTTYTVTDLAQCNTYYFAVTAFNQDNESGYSNEVSQRIACPVPEPPRNLRCSIVQAIAKVFGRLFGGKKQLRIGE